MRARAYSHAHNLAARQRLDHSGFRQRVSVTSGAAAENVAYGCATEDCVIRMWARSGRHRANMLRRDVTSYGIASADGGNGRRYWVLELGKLRRRRQTNGTGAPASTAITTIKAIPIPKPINRAFIVSALAGAVPLMA